MTSATPEYLGGGTPNSQWFSYSQLESICIIYPSRDMLSRISKKRISHTKVTFKYLFVRITIGPYVLAVVCHGLEKRWGIRTWLTGECISKSGYVLNHSKFVIVSTTWLTQRCCNRTRRSQSSGWWKQDAINKKHVKLYQFFQKQSAESSTSYVGIGMYKFWV